MKILIATVGGSPEPVINAINHVSPDFVFFVCSEKGPAQRSSIVVVHDQILPVVGQIPHEIVMVPPDDLVNCYKTIEAIGERIEKREKNLEKVIANYTGGTKTMSVALALVALMRKDWELQLNIGPRIELFRIHSGDFPVLQPKIEILIDMAQKAIDEAVNDFRYSDAVSIIEEICQLQISGEKRSELLKIRTLCLAFDAWDRFDHDRAYEHLRAYADEFHEHIKYLAHLRVKEGRYELVGDLLRNSERRAYQKRYDDAVARLYRALELFAQLRLREHFKGEDNQREEQHGSIVLMSHMLPESLREKYSSFDEKGKLKLGLDKSYELLFDLGDAVGNKYMERKNALLDILKLRNNSILAHGLTPLDEKDYLKAKGVIESFLKEVASAIKASLEVPQLPRRLRSEA